MKINTRGDPRKDAKGIEPPDVTTEDVTESIEPGDSIPIEEL